MCVCVCVCHAHEITDDAHGSLAHALGDDVGGDVARLARDDADELEDGVDVPVCVCACV